MPDREVVTPLGLGDCIGLVDDTANVEWIVVIKATGEPWFFRNPHVRFAPCVTDGRPAVSSFDNISRMLQRQIDRYKKNGWL